MVSVPLTGVVVGTAALTTGIRYQLNVRFCGAKLFTPSKASSSPNASLLEECWLFVLSNILLGLSTWALVYHNDACSFVDTSACFSDWRRQVNSPQQQVVFSISLGWYIHGVIKSLVPGIGLHAGNDMVAHHLVTVVAFGAAYAFQLERMGLLLLGILNISNPFMHFAKVLHYSGFAQKYKVAAFSTFAVAFFVSRLVLFPIQVYWNGISAIIEHWHEASLVPGVVCLVLATFLQALQVFWFYRIVRILVNGKADKAPSKPNDASTTAALKSPLLDGEKNGNTILEQTEDAVGRKTDVPEALECSSVPTSEADFARASMPDGFLVSENGSEVSTTSTNPVTMDDSAHGADGCFHRPGDMQRHNGETPYPSFEEMAARRSQQEAAEPKKLK